jgi:hypothetical protein
MRATSHVVPSLAMALAAIPLHAAGAGHLFINMVAANARWVI